MGNGYSTGEEPVPGATSVLWDVETGCQGIVAETKSVAYSMA
jgi:hypothetical protein